MSLVYWGLATLICAIIGAWRSSLRGRKRCRSIADFSASAQGNTILPNGLAVWTLGEGDLTLPAVYQQIFLDKVYLKHAIVVPPEGVVLDVGANIGLFSVWLSQNVRGVKIHAFEPIPQTFAALSRNLSKYCPTNATPQPFGLWKEDATVEFQHDFTVSAGSSMNSMEMLSVISNISPLLLLSAIWQDLARLHFGVWMRIWTIVAVFLHLPFLRPLARALLLPITALFPSVDDLTRNTASRVSCSLRTLSGFLAAQHIERIDLLKLDVEGAEWDIIQSLSASDWRKVQQVVVEVHDINGRLAAIQQRLEQHGFMLVTEQEDWQSLRLQRISTIYAVRKV